MDEKDNFAMDVQGAITSAMAIPRKVVDNFRQMLNIDRRSFWASPCIVGVATPTSGVMGDGH
jgi:hypothetical protein